MNHHEVAAALAQALGRPVRYTSVPAEDFVALLVARGFAPEYGQFLAEALIDVATGHRRIPVADTVERVTGRRPYSVVDFARHHAAELAAG